MSSGQQWLNWLASGNVAGFLCRRDGAGVVIVDRTPTFEAMADPSWPGEEALVAGLVQGWPDRDGSPSVLYVDDAPEWTCVVQAIDDHASSCVGIVRRTTARQRYNDGFHSIVETLPDIVARMDRNHRHLYINPAIEQMTGLSPQAFIGRSKREVGLPPELVAQWESLVDTVLATAAPAEVEHELPTVHGSRQFLTRAVPEYRADGELATILSTSHDITELKSLQRQLAVLASTDPLTALLNRRGFEERAQAELSRARFGRGQLSLLLLDINNFKAINDKHGHMVGDHVLVAIAEVLRRAVGPDDFAARIGGDEFCVGLVESDGDSVRAAAERIRRRIRDLGTDDGCPCAVSVSIGLTTDTGADQSVSDLMAHADQSMYADKSARRKQR
ncbi:GGDEF domain-containing protein [Mycolicibacterium psychrotolerans]|uniref:GGDEF domain-containing protein n=1 Tax=Mycolicibacterium psychrotolerans TaxID=216929 RepID=UPI003D67F42C